MRTDNAAAPASPGIWRGAAGAALLILTALNFINYIDRSVLFAVQPLIQQEFQRGDAEFGLLTSVFFIFYMCTAPFIGPLADRYPRRLIMAAGAAVWSGATLLTAVTYNFTELLIRHTVVGIGEATFVTIAPAYIADFFPEHHRGRVLSIFYLAIPAGTALGYLLGGYSAGVRPSTWAPPPDSCWRCCCSPCRSRRAVPPTTSREASSVTPCWDCAGTKPSGLAVWEWPC
jgi:MFS family permease